MNTCYKKQLTNIIKNTQLFEILKYLHQIDQSVYLAAGAIRNTVWSVLHGQIEPLHEIDVIFYDVQDKHHAKTVQRINDQYPNLQWDIINQAYVHEWYRCDDGTPLAPLCSIEHALSLWPETATAIAVRFTKDDDLEIIAPFGLADLFEFKLRWNPHLVRYETFLQRITSKQFLQRWSKLKLVEPFV